MAARRTPGQSLTGWESAHRSVAAFHLRAATMAELDILVRHRRLMFIDMGMGTRRQLDLADSAYRRVVRQELARRRLLGLLATDSRGVVIGSCCLWLRPVLPRPGASSRPVQPYLLSLFIEPSHRRRGLGSQLIRALVRWARARGYGRITLHASEMGRSMYEHLGFLASNEMRLDGPLLRKGVGRKSRRHVRRVGSLVRARHKREVPSGRCTATRARSRRGAVSRPSSGVLSR
jgi:GNAT superfamily N-acetyltransferase